MKTNHELKVLCWCLSIGMFIAVIFIANVSDHSYTKLSHEERNDLLPVLLISDEDLMKERNDLIAIIGNTRAIIALAMVLAIIAIWSFYHLAKIGVLNINALFEE